MAINRVPGTPIGSLGLPSEDVVVVDPVTGRSAHRAEFDAAGALRNGHEAIGEIVNRSGTGRFEGYYNDPAATAERTAERLVLDRRPGLPRRRTAGSGSPGAAVTGCGSTRRT